MKAIVYTEYGSPEVLRLEEVQMPAPKDDEVLVKVRAASVNAADLHRMTGEPFIVRLDAGLRKPKITRLGVDFAGQIEAVGRDITQFHVGDEVFGLRTGAFAEYIIKKEKTLVRKPANLTFEQAAALPVAGCTALEGLRDKGNIQPGERVLINGAGGGVGGFAVQIAKALGGQVTAVCGAHNVEMVRSIGADHVIDYSKEDFTQSEQRFDLLFDNVGNHSLAACRRVMAPGGTIVLVAAPVSTLLATLLLTRLGNKSLVSFITAAPKGHIVALKELAEAGKLTPVIDRRYSLSEVPDALRYMQAGHVRGKLVVNLDWLGQRSAAPCIRSGVLSVNNRTAETSPLARARLAGFLYLLTIPLGIFGGLYIPSRLVVSGDPAATAKNIVASESLFRLAIVSEMLAPVILIVVVTFLYQLLKPVSRTAALIIVLFLVAGVPIALLNKLNQLAALVLFNPPAYLGAFATEQVQALAQVFLRLHGLGSNIAFIFWGLWLLPLGYLVFKSGFMPRVLGILLVISCLGYLTDTFVTLLGYSVNIGLFTAWGEILFVLWLLVKGVNTQRWEQRALAAA